MDTLQKDHTLIWKFLQSLSKGDHSTFLEYLLNEREYYFPFTIALFEKEGKFFQAGVIFLRFLYILFNFNCIICITWT